MPPGFMRVEKHEQIGRAVSLVFAIVALRLTRRRWDWLAHFTNQLCWMDFRRSKPPDAWDRPLRHKGRAHPPYGRHSVSFTSGMHHILWSHGFRSSSARRRRTVSRDSPSCSVKLDHLTGQQIERPALTAFRVGSSRPSPPATPSPCRIACGRLQDALLRFSARSRLPSTKRRLVR